MGVVVVLVVVAVVVGRVVRPTAPGVARPSSAWAIVAHRLVWTSGGIHRRPRRPPPRLVDSAAMTAPPVDTGLVASLRGLDRDGRLLFAMRTLRMFGYGFLAVVLVLYLAALGLDPLTIGIVLTLTLVGDTLDLAVADDARRPVRAAPGRSSRGRS